MTRTPSCIKACVEITGCDEDSRENLQSYTVCPHWQTKSKSDFSNHGFASKTHTQMYLFSFFIRSRPLSFKNFKTMHTKDEVRWVPNYSQPRLTHLYQIQSEIRRLWRQHGTYQPPLSLPILLDVTEELSTMTKHCGLQCRGIHLYSSSSLQPAVLVVFISILCILVLFVQHPLQIEVNDAWTKKMDTITYK